MKLGESTVSPEK